MMLQLLMISLMVLGLGTVAHAASFTLSGTYLNVGVSNSGGLIDDAFTYGINPVGTNVDFLKPGNPFEFYSIGVNGSWATAGWGGGYYTPANPFNTTTNDISSLTPGKLTASSMGFFTLGGSQLQIINQFAWFDKNEMTIHFSADLLNMGSTTATNVVYARGLDPDQDVNGYGSSSTINTMTANSVSAYGPLSKYTISIIDNAMSVTGVPSVSNWATDPYYLLTAGTIGDGDYTIAMAWNIGDIGPHQSVEIDYAYKISAVPLPPSILFLAPGLAGLALVRKRIWG